MNCPICDNNDSRIVRSFFPRFYYCLNCEGHFLREDSAPEYAEDYYELESRNLLSKSITRAIRAFFLRARFKKVKSILKNIPNSVVLDYGCGPGNFVKYALKKNLKIFGYESSKSAVRLAKENSLPVYDSVVIAQGKYDLITFWGSLEHADNPKDIVIKCRNYLKEGGKLLIALQNADSFEARLAKEKWFHYDYPFHRIQFTPTALKKILEQNGYEVSSFDFFFPEYTVSGLIQTFLNFLFPKNAFYYVVSNRRLSASSAKTIFINLFSLLSLLVFSPILLLFFLVALVFKKTGAMVVLAKKA
ncbi:MAG: Methylase involved in ubiquinone/menaquinone biosynthesis [Candidatus Azambacteria bacterium GW2011_GWE1_42_9]|nr:MAG: Methylase involved in ubiquinone/menaquinone biosynthesis [Candidatus Azambacteria bacterium GW2011_GWF1_41_10]KKS49265.1 MAG: Methylase involved in ubiquinone/menaquinone biosynthesis [Candidatus Azambacteria bacterium GW2011_GWF2_42_22]KKS69378.1 MAG: Methylase involved in ubiquinone/menaquinone biosynthesis [Candidatus Azambacteria bacterium GW2011_GWA2_42_62]KKS74227.1 MAG: Methylase involved in ubiquinone/menaquinone biosynthesis [Candidatus Azambacteria bacterium GW2011_GWB1_42_72]